MAFTRGRFGTFGGTRRLVWGATPHARSVRPNAGSPFFRPATQPAARGLTMSASQPTVARPLAA